MPDSQLIVLAIAVLAIVAGTLITNSRISHLGNRVGNVKEAVRAGLRAVDARLNAKPDQILRIGSAHLQ